MSTEAPKVTGSVKQRALSSVAPNGWNPNRLTERLMASLEHGMRTEGWLASQPLLIWGTDENGDVKNLIIDGEHRWHTAKKVGFKQGPMVVLDGLSEIQAKALTVKLDQRRGSFDPAELGELMRELESSGLFGTELPLEFGFEDAAFEALVAPPSSEGPGDFREVDEDNLRTDHKCPKCGFEF